MFEVRPLTEQTWGDLEELFDLPGGSIVRGCWCMFYRTVGQVSVNKAAGPGRKQELHALVRSGTTPGLVGYAIDFARDQGVRMLEAYPVDKPERSHDDFMFFGSRSLYERAGFREVVRRSPTRLVMRRALRPRASAIRDTQVSE